MDAKATTKVRARKPSYRFCLYVAGKTPRSTNALENLQKLCERQFPGHYKIEVIDVTTKPQLARTENIVAVPTLVRTYPEPMRRVIGDLSNAARLLSGLDLGLSA